MTTNIEIGNVWSNQEVDVWICLSEGIWRVERRRIPLWNYMGSLGPTHPRLCKGAYLFPVGMSPLEMEGSADVRAA